MTPRAAPRGLASPLAVVLCIAATCLLVTPPAWGQEVDGATFRRLAEQAQTDPGALRALRDVDRVDGRPVDVERALAGAEEDELAGRLTILAGPSDGPASDPAEARRRAHEILSEERFQASDPPRPFRGILERGGRWLSERIQGFPGGSTVFWIVLALVVAAAAAAIAHLIASRRGRAADERSRRARAVDSTDDPRALERLARKAEAAGDLDEAIRLLFRAGLLRLDARGAIRYRPSITTTEVRRRLRIRSFDRTARLFDDVVYGERPAAPDDVETSRKGWRRVLQDVR